MKKYKIILSLVGALLCAPAFTACQDDPEPTGGNVAGKDDPAGNGGGQSTDWYKSWFEQPEEEQWMLRWMQDDGILRPPGEYTYRIPADGGSFSFWFPDCDARLEYADFNGVFATEKNVNGYENIIYTKVGENGINIRLNRNPLKTEVRYSFHYFNTKGARVSFMFVQDGAPEEDIVLNGQLIWHSDKSKVYLSGSTNDIIYEIYPESGRSEFSIRCLNADGLRITSVKTSEGDIFSTDGTVAECGDATVSIVDDAILFSIGENTSDSLKNFELTVASGDESSKFVVTQSCSGYVDESWRGILEPPQLMLVNDGSRWTEPRVFKVDPEGAVYDFRILNYYNFKLHRYYINGSYCPPNWGGSGVSVIVDGWAPMTENAITCKMPQTVFNDNDDGDNDDSDFYNNKDYESFKIFPNYTNTERVMEAVMMYSKTYFGNCKFLYLTFVQPPLKESGKI